MSALLIVAPGARAEWLATGTPIATAVDYQMNPTLIPDGHNGAILAWEDSRSGTGYPDLYMQHVDSSGVPTWTYGGYPLCTATDLQYAPVLLPDGYGGAMVFWNDYRSGDSDVYGQVINAGGVAEWAPNGIAISNATGGQGNVVAVSDFNPAITIGSWPGAILAWTDSRISNNNVDIFVQHIDRAAGGTWTANGVQLCNAAYGQYAPAIATDGTGFASGPKGAIVVWDDYRLGFETPADIYAGRVSSGGVVSWGLGGVPVCTAEGGQGDPRIAAVGSGRVIVSWTDSRSAGPGIYAQKLDASGAALWAADGVSACIAPGIRSRSQIVSDGAGGAILVWMDYRNGNWDLYAQRLDPNGVRLWGDAGKPVCTTSAQLNLTQMIPDGAGGAFVLWEDNREPGTTYVYLQHIDSYGHPLLAVDGIRVATNPTNEVNPRLTGSGDGVIVVWQDWRSTFYDIYANRIATAGTVDVPVGATAAFGVRLAGPNPVRGPARFAVELPRLASLTAEVFDPQGRRLRTLERGATFAAGIHPLTWDGTDESGAPASPGIYFLRVDDGSRSAAVRLVRLR